MGRLDFDIFKASKRMLAPATGRVLIAEPFLQGAYFSRSIVLLTEYSPKKGAVGFILNKSSEIYPDELIEDLWSFRGQLFIGGPVGADSLNFIHSLGDQIPGSLRVTDNIYWGGDFEKLKELINKKKVAEGEVKFFAGYAGWAPGQLEQELEEKSWVVATLDEARIMSNRLNNIWRESLEDLGDIYRSWSNFPRNPHFN